MALPQVKENSHNRSDKDYADWTLEERELRSFLLSTNRGMLAWFQEREAAANESVRDMNPEEMYGGEAFDAFMDDTGVFWSDYWERVASLVIKDAFRLYEVFLFESAHRVARRHGSGLLKHGTEDTWTFPVCEQFYSDYLGLQVLPPRVEAAKWIRNKLTHLADLQSVAGTAQLAIHKETLGLDLDPTDEELAFGLSHENEERTFGQKLRFTPLQTWRILDAIRDQANVIGEAVHGYVWDKSKSTQALTNLAKGVPVNPKQGKKKGDASYLTIPTQ